ncbi:ABC transporter permease [Ornithinimicrobium faecis]|uniref:ABC transporter permease n=1 Tax=Ornithinimicrobium faecis TaxID=2934158 RepID=UPI002118F015|nr:ABC transporter permease [Ornithinimicrobium sp. HY1745]
MLVVAFVAMSLASPYFLTTGNLLGLLQYTAVVGMLAVGQTLVILGGDGGIDLSVGSMLSLCSVSFGLIAARAELSPWLAAILTIGVGLLLGAINGLLVTWVKLPPLIVTLGTMYLFASAATVLAGGADVSGFDREGFSTIGQTSVLGVPFQVLCVLIPVYLVFALVLSRTTFGRSIYVMGSSSRGAQLSGIPVARNRLYLYMISGGVAALGAIVMASWLLNAKSAGGTGMELQAITMAVLGGTAITGGRGTLSGTFLAMLLVAVLQNGLQLAGVGSTIQLGLMGAVLIVSMLIRQKSTSYEAVA